MVASLPCSMQFFLQASLSALATPLSVSYNLDPASIGLLSSFFFYPYILLQVPAGMLVQQLGAKHCLVAGMIGVALSCLIFSNADHFWIACMARVFMGIFSCVFFASVVIISFDAVSLHHSVLAVGVVEIMALMGAVIGLPIFGAALQHLSWHTLFIVISGICLLVAAVVQIFIKPLRPSALVELEGRGVGRRGFARSGVWKDVLVVCKSGRVWMIVSFIGCTYAVIGALAGLWVVPFLTVAYKINTATATFGSSVLFFGTCIFTVLWGAVFPRLRHKRLLMIVVSSLDLLILATIWFINWRFSTILVMLFLLGALSSNYVVGFYLLRAAISEKVRPIGIALGNMILLLIGNGFLQPFIGFLIHEGHGQQSYHQTGYDLSDFFLPFIVLIALKAASVIITILVPMKHAEEAEVVPV